MCVIHEVLYAACGCLVRQNNGNTTCPALLPEAKQNSTNTACGLSASYWSEDGSCVKHQVELEEYWWQQMLEKAMAELHIEEWTNEEE
jgi:hypothetical protein